MKHFRSFTRPVGVAFSLFALSLSLAAQTFVSGTGDANGTTNTVYVASAARGGTPVVEYLSATSDVATAAVQFWTAGPSVLVTAESSGTNVVTSGGTNSFAANDAILLRALGSDQYQKTTVGLVTATNITTLSALARTLSAGDVIYKLTAGGKIPVGVGTVSVVGVSWAGQAGKPLVLTLTGNTNCSINTVTVANR